MFFFFILFLFSVQQSKFDHFQLSAFEGIECTVEQEYNPPWKNNITCSATDSAAIGAFGQNFMQAFDPVLAQPGPHRATFLTSCVLHGMDYHFLSVQNTSMNVAFNVWHRALANPADPPVIDNDFKWVEDRAMPRTDNPLACPPFSFQ